MSSPRQPVAGQKRSEPVSPFRVGGENQGTHYYLLGGNLARRDVHPEASFRNVYRGNELVGSILYDTSPVSGLDEIEVFSFYIKPKYRHDLRRFMALVGPLLRDGRPLDTMFGVVMDPKLEELIPRAIKSGRVRMGSQWTARQREWELMLEKTRAIEEPIRGRSASDRG